MRAIINSLGCTYIVTSHTEMNSCAPGFIPFKIATALHINKMHKICVVHM